MIHERDAFPQMFKMLSARASNLPPAVVRCFGGSAEQARSYVELGLYIGLSGKVGNE
jgi:TatD DNase family protein